MKVEFYLTSNFIGIWEVSIETENRFFAWEIETLGM